MIVTQLIGGLGNQLFQYAAGRALAQQYHVPVKVDITELTKQANGKYTQRQFELDVFTTKIEIATSADLDVFKNKKDTKIFREVQRQLPFLFKTLIATESGANFQANFFKYPKKTYLKGFWQSEVYFKLIENIIREELEFNYDVKNNANDWYQKISNVNSISLHVRRGDYVTNKNTNQYHGLCSIEYYNNAISYLKKDIGNNIELFIFSDDIDWCKQNIFTDVHINFVETNNHYQDLYLMSQCQHNIIANSSFSWWGAWLNKNKQKIVIAPQKWFNDSAININDLIPTSWLKM